MGKTKLILVEGLPGKATVIPDTFWNRIKEPINHIPTINPWEYGSVVLLDW